MLEKDFEDIICKYPELIEEGLILISRQLSLYGRRIDILFEDKFKRKLLIELKAGPIKDDHIGQILSYEGMLLSADDPTLRVMLVGTRVPFNIQKSLDHHGIAWKEITFSFLKDFLKMKGDESFNQLFPYDEPMIRKVLVEMQNEFPKQYNSEGIKENSELIVRLKTSDYYKSLKNVLAHKIKNEAKAKEIIERNMGHLRSEHVREILELIDYPYPFVASDKINKGPWFGRLFKSNTLYILNEGNDKINNWFKILSANHLPAEKRIELLLREPYKIKGLNVGFITTMLYLLDKITYSIWFKAQHNGLKQIYPDLEKFTGKSMQYQIFNDLSKDFVRKFNFEHTELDWVFSAGLSYFREKR